MAASMPSDRGVSSSFKPPFIVNRTARWTLDGYSWIALDRIGENCDSPELFKIGDVALGLRVLLKTSEPDHISVYVYAKGSSGDFGMEISIQLLSTRPAAPDVCGRMNKGTVRLINGTFRTTARPSDLNEDWGFTQFLRRDAAEYYCRNDAMTFELTINAWSKDAVAERRPLEVDEDEGARSCSAALLADYGRLLAAGEFCDVELLPAGDGPGLMAHKLVLAARSPVFKQMFFQSGMQESEAHSKVAIPELDAEVTGIFLHALYTNEIKIDAWTDDEILCHLFVAFNKYQVLDLMTRCEARIVALLSEDVVAERLMMADLHDATVLRKAALEYMTAPDVLCVVQGTEGFSRLVEQRPKIMAEILARSVPPAAKRPRTKGPQELPGQLPELRLSELKSLCAERGLRVTGSKLDLIERLRASAGS